MEVHRQLGHGFLEAVYAEAMKVELHLRGVPFVTELELPLRYKGVVLQCRYKADFLCLDSVIVELKALPTITSVEIAQVINYLKASGHELGLLLNFGAPSLEWKRLIQSESARARRDRANAPATHQLSAQSAKSADQLLSTHPQSRES